MNTSETSISTPENNENGVMRAYHAITRRVPSASQRRGGYEFLGGLGMTLGSSIGALALKQPSIDSLAGQIIAAGSASGILIAAVGAGELVTSLQSANNSNSNENSHVASN